MRVPSPLLSAFWGREMWMGAIVLLPHGFDEHPAWLSPGRSSHSDAQYSSFVIVHTKYTKRRLNDSTAHG